MTDYKIINNNSWTNWMYERMYLWVQTSTYRVCKWISNECRVSFAKGARKQRGSCFPMQTTDTHHNSSTFPSPPLPLKPTPFLLFTFRFYSIRTLDFDIHWCFYVHVFTCTRNFSPNLSFILEKLFFLINSLLTTHFSIR